MVRFHETISREQSLGIDGFGCDFDPKCFYYNVRVEPALRFRGDLVGPVHITDFRLYIPSLVEAYQARGGVIRHGRVSPDNFAPVVEGHDLTVVATGGRDPLASLFPEVAGESLGKAQRALLVGLFDGVAVSDPPSISLTIAPNRGGLFIAPMWTPGGVKTVILIGATLGGPWQELVQRDYRSNLESLTGPLLEFLRSVEADSFTPIDDAKFALTRPVDILQGGVELRVRRPWAEVTPGKYVVGLGDAVTTVDPLIGQGANLTSNCAGALAEAIAADLAFDEIFVKEWERQQWELAEPVVRWNNLALGDTPAQVVKLLISCASNKPAADAFARLYENGRQAWPSLVTPERVDRFIERAASNA
ncbi:MAG TPA: styrene monooxygenase/indole monooxygenase family protein [Micromonosporaceae bacterium]